MPEMCTQVAGFDFGRVGALAGYVSSLTALEAADD